MYQKSGIPAEVLMPASVCSTICLASWRNLSIQNIYLSSYLSEGTDASFIVQYNMSNFLEKTIYLTIYLYI